MKIFIKNIKNCSECPNIIAEEFDDVGFGFTTYYCKIVTEKIRNDFGGTRLYYARIENEPTYEIIDKYKQVPNDFKIPEWCPLKDK